MSETTMFLKYSNHISSDKGMQARNTACYNEATFSSLHVGIFVTAYDVYVSYYINTNIKVKKPATQVVLQKKKKSNEQVNTLHNISQTRTQKKSIRSKHLILVFI